MPILHEDLPGNPSKPLTRPLLITCLPAGRLLAPYLPVGRQAPYSSLHTVFYSLFLSISINSSFLNFKGFAL